MSGTYVSGHLLFFFSHQTMKKLLTHNISVVLFTFILCMQAFRVSSQVELPSFFIQNFSQQDYQASCQNWDLTITSDGCLYVANNSGLLVFDGNSWTTHELPEQSVIYAVTLYRDTVFTGQNNDFGYWITDAAGVLSYHSIRHLLPELKLKDETFTTLIAHKESLWLKSENYLLQYTDGHLSVYPVPAGSSSRLFKGGERLFLSVINTGLYEITGNGLVLLPGTEIFRDKEIAFIYPTGVGSYLIGTVRNGIYTCVNGVCTLWKTSVDEELKRAVITSFAASGNLFFIGTLNQGMYIVTSSGAFCKHFALKKYLQDNNVHAIYLGDEQSLWLALDNGISQIYLHSPLTLLEERSEVGKLINATFYEGALLLQTNQGVFRQTVTPEGRFLPEPYTKTLPESFTSNEQTLLDKLPVEVIDSLLPIRNVMEEKNQIIWGVREGNKVWRIRLSNTPGVVESVKIYGENDGITTASVTDIAVVDDIVTLATGNGFFRYDKAKDCFVNDEELNTQLYRYTGGNMIFPVPDTHYWITMGNEAALFSIKDRNVQLKCRVLLDNYNLNTVNKEKRIIPLCDSLHLISAMEGILLVNTRQLIENNLIGVTSPRIMGIEYWDASGVHRFPVTVKEISLPADFGKLTVRAATSVYTPMHQISYMLEGVSSDWSAWQKEGDISLLQLPVGKYELKIRRFVVKGPFPETTLGIEVRPHWYDTIWAYVIYLLLVWGIVQGGLRYYLKNERRKEQERQDTNRLAEQQKVHCLKNEMLETELQNKTNELTLQTSALVKKNQAMQALQQELEHQKETLGDRYPNKLYNKMKLLIDENLNDQADWLLFESYFNSAHQNFIDRLRARYSDLTTGDLRICCLLRMNLSTKEIASMLNISVRSVELRRYRLRKRLALDGDENLVDFLLSF